ncbi:MAG: SIMPL domain-containing protein [Betaproteobacteria bacterium]|nr:SIMPL domain-containing protein [Betaproteobacteria bacterium]
MENRISSALIGMSIVLAIGLAVSSFILGTHFKTLGNHQQKITVKGLAEKEVKADLAEWSVGIAVKEENFAKTLQKLRASRPALDEFLKRQGFPETEIVVGSESVVPNMEDEYIGTAYRRVQKGFRGSQTFWIRSRDLPRIIQADKEIIQSVADGNPITYKAPNYLIDDLENIKMSLIGAATENARQRAGEFAKVGQVKIGTMRAASQGAFYILSANSDTDTSDDYGGIYDKSTIDKKARVVVTIEYGIE